MEERDNASELLVIGLPRTSPLRRSRKFICRNLDREVQIWGTEIRIGEISPRSPHPLIIGDPFSFHGLAARTRLMIMGAKLREGCIVPICPERRGNVF